MLLSYLSLIEIKNNTRDIEKNSVMPAAQPGGINIVFRKFISGCSLLLLLGYFLFASTAANAAKPMKYWYVHSSLSVNIPFDVATNNDCNSINDTVARQKTKANNPVQAANIFAECLVETRPYIDDAYYVKELPAYQTDTILPVDTWRQYRVDYPIIHPGVGVTENYAWVGPAAHLFYECADGSSPNVSKPFDEQCPDIHEKDQGEPSCELKGGTNPINIANGNKYQRELDYAAASTGLSSFTRYYNSIKKYDVFTMGPNWRHTFYSHAIHYQGLPNDTLSFYRPGGETFVYSYVNGKWQGDADSTTRVNNHFDALGELDGWEYTTASEQVERYDLSGKLVSITSSTGLVQSFAYNVDGRLETVTGPYGHTMTFTHNGNEQLATMTTHDGGVYAYEYDRAQNLISVTYPDNSTRQYLYENTTFANALTGIIDENGDRFATWSYDTDGRAISSEHANGQENATVTYNADGSSTVANANGDSQTVFYELIQGEHKATQTQGVPCSSCSADNAATTYDDNGFIASRTDFNGNTTTYIKNARGLEESRTEAAGTAQARTITTEWHPNYRLPTKITRPSVATGKSAVTTISYGDTNYPKLPTQITRTGFGPDGSSVADRTIALQYTDGHITQLDGPRTDVSDITTFTYYPNTAKHGNNRGQLRSVTNALGHTVSYVNYDSHGNVLKMVDANGTVTEYEYDARQRLVAQAVTPADYNIYYTREPGEPLQGFRVTTYSYDGVGQLLSTTTPVGITLNYTYDAARYLRSVEDNLGNRIEYDYDLNGNRTQEVIKDPDGVLIRMVDYTFDSRDRVESINAAGSLTSLIYDEVGNLTSTTDPNKNPSTTHEYDSLDRLFKTVDALTGETVYDYDINDRITLVKAPNDATTTYSYDDLGNLWSETSPDRGDRVYTYDSAGNLKTLTDARNITVNYTYDAIGRVTTIDYPGTAEDVSFIYDSATGCTNGIGRLCKITDESGITSYAYDAFGNVTKQDKTELGIIYSTAYSYDAGDNITSMTYPGDRVVDYNRDLIRRITSLDATINGSQKTIVSDVQYRADNQLVKQTFGNDVPETRNYDLQGRVEQINRNLIAENGLAGNAVRNDFNADGHADVLFRHTDGSTAIWLIDSLTRWMVTKPGKPSFEWAIKGSGDFNGDGTVDIFWQKADGTTEIWPMANGQRGLSTFPGSLTSEFIIKGTGDFNGDGTDDIVYRHADGTVRIWLMQNGLKHASTQSVVVSSDWKIVSVGDMNGDGIDDLVWSHTNGSRTIWLMNQNGKPYEGRSMGTVLTDWKIVNTGDFNNDGIRDILWRNVNGSTTIWEMGANGSPVIGHYQAVVPTDINLVSVGDFDGDGTDDILWRDSAGVITAWKMDNFARVSEHTIGTPSVGWEIAANEHLENPQGADLRFVNTPVTPGPLSSHLREVAASVPSQLQQDMIVIVPSDNPGTDGRNNYYARTNDGNNWHQLNKRTALNKKPDMLVYIGKGYLDVWQRSGSQITYQYQRMSVSMKVSQDSARLIKVSLSIPNSSVETRTYTYDDNGNVLGITKPTGIQGYAYDELDRLTQDSLPGEVPIELGYDANGNRNSHTQGGVTVPYTYNPGSNVLNNIDGSGITHDAAGNRTSDRGGNRTFEYNQTGRLFKVYEGSNAIAVYTYNALGQRTRKVTLTGTTVYHYDLNGQLISETNTDGTPVKDYVWRDNEPVAQIDVNGATDTVTYLHTDHLATPRLGTNEQGVAVWRWEGEAFGNTAATGTATVNLRFPGQYYDSETQLHYNWFRYYDPEIGRYVTSDPIGLDGGLNSFEYSYSNPTGFIDIAGLDSVPGSPNPTRPSIGIPTASDFICVPVEAICSSRENDIAEHNRMRDNNLRLLQEACDIKYNNCAFRADLQKCISEANAACSKSRNAEQKGRERAIERIRQRHLPVDGIKDACDSVDIIKIYQRLSGTDNR